MTTHDTIPPTEDEIRLGLAQIATWATPTVTPELPDTAAAAPLVADLDDRRGRRRHPGELTWLAAAAVLAVLVGAAVVIVGANRPEEPAPLTDRIDGALDFVPPDPLYLDVVDLTALRSWLASDDATPEEAQKIEFLLATGLGWSRMFTADTPATRSPARSPAWLDGDLVTASVHATVPAARLTATGTATTSIAIIATDEDPASITSILVNNGYTQEADGRFVAPPTPAPDPDAAGPSDPPLRGTFYPTVVVEGGYVVGYGDGLVDDQGVPPTGAGKLPAAVSLVMAATPDAAAISLARTNALAVSMRWPGRPVPPLDDVTCGSADASAFGPNGFEILSVTGERTGTVEDPAATLAENPGLLGSSNTGEGEVTGVRTVGTVTVFDIRPGTMGMVGHYPLGVLIGDALPVVEC